MSIVRFTASKLLSTGKKGTLTPDSEGYYTQNIGALNCLNSVGELYVLEGAKELFQSSSGLMRRINNGALRGENGHPSMKPGMSEKQYVNRILTVEKENVCCHFKEVYLDYNHQDNRGVVPIVGKVAPSGQLGYILEKMYAKQSENVAYSIRALTRDQNVGGRNHRTLVNIVTWDHVEEPGISIATKWDSPALESLCETVLRPPQLLSVAQDILDDVFALESTKDIAMEMIHLANLEMGTRVRSVLLKW